MCAASRRIKRGRPSDKNTPLIGLSGNQSSSSEFLNNYISEWEAKEKPGFTHLAEMYGTLCTLDWSWYDL